MTVVVGTAGHVDHGKTTLLRALTGIDADRLPEERRRGMTIDVGYAHGVLPNGRLLDFVDVPGHDGLIANMLVGAGEIDAAMLVVAADDGPRAQTLEHLALLDALGIGLGLAAITKTDLVEPARVEAVRADVIALLAITSLAGAPVVAVGAEGGTGLEALLAALVALEARASTRLAAVGAGRRERASARLAIDRVFSVRGRGTVVTGSLRGGPIETGAALRLLPGDHAVRAREIQVHGAAVAGADPGRTAINLAAVEAASLSRGMVLAMGPGVEVTDRVLVTLRRPPRFPGVRDEAPWPPADRTAARLHVGTAQVGVRVGRTGREAATLEDAGVTAVLRLDESVALAIGDPIVLRRPSPGLVVAGGVVLDPLPPRGPMRRRFDAARLRALVAGVEGGAAFDAVEALTALHGVLPAGRAAAIADALGGHAEGAGRDGAAATLLAADVAEALSEVATRSVTAHAAESAVGAGSPSADLRRTLGDEARRRFGLAGPVATKAVAVVLDRLLADGRLVRDGDGWSEPGRATGPPDEVVAAMARLEASLSVAAPPSLGDAARTAGCPPDAIRILEAQGRIVRLEPDLAWAADAYRRLEVLALAMARREPLSPAALRDGTGTSRRYVLAILEDLDRRGILRRTPAGHVPGPRAPRLEAAVDAPVPVVAAPVPTVDGSVAPPWAAAPAARGPM